MCEAHAICPNCGQPDLDEDEKRCLTWNGIATREYRCHSCDAQVTVTVRVPSTRLEPSLFYG